MVLRDGRGKDGTDSRTMGQIWLLTGSADNIRLTTRRARRYSLLVGKSVSRPSPSWRTRRSRFSSQLIIDPFQLLCQCAHDLAELNEAACGDCNGRSFQVLADGYAKLIGSANSFPREEREHAA